MSEVNCWFDKSAMEKVVSKREFDAQRLRADTAEAELAKLGDDYCKRTDDLISANEKLAAAEQRITELENQMQQAVNLLSEARSLIPDFGGSKRFSAFRLNFPKFINAIGFTRTDLPKKVDAALYQKTEGEIQ